MPSRLIARALLALALPLAAALAVAAVVAEPPASAADPGRGGAARWDGAGAGGW